ncbi:MAG: FeoA family protein [Candidatus Margulisbacteria bacterium]|nr:FeoA family protein [Candidatus Margulisiibacteriota bacterium]
METALTNLKKGDKAEIVRVSAVGEIRRRLLDMGVCRGTHIKILRVAPLGDPIEIFLKGFNLSLRKEEAANIYVIRIGELGDGKPMGLPGRRQSDGQEGCGA